MTTTIAAVDTERSIEYGVLIDLTLIAINPTTGASGTGSTATITFAAQASSPFVVGDTITVSNMVPTEYNGTFVVTAATTSSVSYASTATGSQTQAGVISITYYISNCYKAVTHNSKTYQALAGFLTISEIQNNISNANDEVQVSLSAIPSAYIAAVLGTQIKGGDVNIYRAFFDYNTQEVITNQVYKRFAGIVSNFSVQEDIETVAQDIGVTHTITIIASSIMGVLENKVSGRRTNQQDYQIYYTEIDNNNYAFDQSMDRVDTLFNQSFDFGKPYTGKAASTVDGGGGSGGNIGNSDNQTSGERY
jgi:hypothetical protein